MNETGAALVTTEIHSALDLTLLKHLTLLIDLTLLKDLTLQH